MRLAARREPARAPWRAGFLAWTALALLAASCAREPSGNAGESPRVTKHVVVIQAMRFDPDSLVVAVGDTVEWDNRDLVPHTSTALDSAWLSGNIAADSSWSTIIAAPGTHPYRCDYHLTMSGRITAR